MITHNCIVSRIASFDSITAAYALVRQELFIERIRGGRGGWGSSESILLMSSPRFLSS